MGKNVRISVNHPVKARLIRFLSDAGGYSESCDELIDLYVEVYDHYQSMREELKKSGLLTEHTNKFGATNITKNPLAIELTKSAQLMSNLLKSMNLTPQQITESREPAEGKPWIMMNEREKCWYIQAAREELGDQAHPVAVDDAACRKYNDEMLRLGIFDEFEAFRAEGYKR